MKKYRFEYFASCPLGLEEILSQEILSLGAKTATISRAGVIFEAFHEVALKVLLHTRIASRVYKFLYTFEVDNEKDFYLEATDIKWKSLMSVNHSFRIHTIFGDLPRERNEFRNSQFATLKLKDAVVDYFRHFENERPSIDKDFPDVVFLSRIERGSEKTYRVTLMYDLCGDSLHERGYRIARTEAPVKENLAASILTLLKWNPEEECLLDAMCGSGTFVIEGAMLAGKIPPSFLRVERHLTGRGHKAWPFLNYPWFTEDKFLQENWQNLVAEVKDLTDKGRKDLEKFKGKIVGSDLSNEAISKARENVKKAGLSEVIDLRVQNALESSPLEGKTLFIANPPYGERLESGEEERLKALYKGMGDHWKHHFKGHRAALFTGNLEMLKVVGLKTSKKHLLSNGDIDCRLAEYDLY